MRAPAPVDPSTITAAGLLGALVVFHSVAGERYIVRRLLRRDNLPRLFGSDVFTKRTLRYAWHLLTVFGLGLVALLVNAAFNGLDAVQGHILAAMLAASAAWGIVATRGRHLSWIVLAACAGLIEIAVYS